MPFVEGGDFTQKSQQSIIKARRIARNNENKQIDALHLLKSLLSQRDSIVLSILKNLEVDVPSLQTQVEKAIAQSSSEPSIYGAEAKSASGQLYLTQDLAKVMQKSREIAKKMDDKYISVEHLFLGIISSEVKAAQVLKQAKTLDKSGEPLDEESVRRELFDIRGEEKVTDRKPESKYEVIKKYTRNLTEMAEEGEIDPVIGREEEIRRIMQVLSRRTKNNPVLIGEAGVGKTAIVEGLAKKIADGNTPESLQGKEVVSLDLGSLIAGTRYRGEFESRMKALIRQIKSAKNHYILFIDELHTLVGAGGAKGAVDASNLLKPALARGEIRAVGATTSQEYQKYIEEDQALERRFQTVYVEEPTVEETLSILRGLREKYEVHHGVKIKDSALKAAAEMSSRYITERFLPDKAVDLMDEAASSLRLELESEPEKLEELHDKITHLQIEKESLNEEDTKKAKKRLKVVERKLADLKERANELEKKWKSEKDLIIEIKDLREKLEELSLKIEQAGRKADLQQMAKIKYGEIPEIKKKISKREKKLQKVQEENRMIKEKVEEEDIAKVVSRWTGIPVTKLMKEEAKKLEKMEDILSKRVIGQEKAINSISNAIRRGRAGVSEEDRPMGVFLFLGPTGVGKTETTKALADFLFNTEESLIRLDMSEYMEKYSVSKILGSAPGYVGYEEGGQLTEKVRRRPYSVILLDEIEKAHPEVFNILLQVFEDGRVSDSKGRTVSFKNTIIIMTSNIGSEYISEDSDVGFTQEEGDAQVKMEKKIQQSLKNNFRPEFLNRLDEVVTFNRLNAKDLKEIVELELEKVRKRVKKNKNIKLVFSDALKKHLVKKGYNPKRGARPLRRAIQKQVLDPLSLKIITSEVSSGERVRLGIRGGNLVFNSSKRSKSKVDNR